MPPRPVAITISPVGKVLPKGVLHGQLKVVVVNTGKLPVDVKVTRTAVTGSGGGCATVRPPQWLRVTPSQMHLNPGQSHVAVMTVNAPSSAHGTYDLVAAFGASVPGSGRVHLTAAAGAQLVVRATGREAVPSCGRHVRAAAPYHPPGAGLLLPVAVIAVVVLAVSTLVTVWALRRWRW